MMNQFFSLYINWNARKKFESILFTVFVILSTYASILRSGNVYGNFYWLLWPSTIFQPPLYMEKEFSINPIYDHTNGPGWDGQFYYYISNDLFITKEESKLSFDAPAYRYQRIGLPLLARIASYLFLQKYVSPTIYFYTNFFVFCFGIVFLVKLFNKLKIPLFWSLAWLTNVGMQSTLLHGLPDVTADCFFIISFYCLLDKKHWWYSLFATLTILSREGYFLIFFFFGLFYLWDLIKEKRKSEIRNIALFVIPGVVFVLWYGYLIYKFGVIPGKQAGGIVMPFLMGLLDAYKKLPNSIGDPNIEKIYHAIYLFTILISIILFFITGIKNKIFFGFVFYSILLGSFGPTVMSFFRDYMKGIAILHLLIPISLYELLNFNCKNKLPNIKIIMNQYIQTGKVNSISKPSEATFQTCVVNSISEAYQPCPFYQVHDSKSDNFGVYLVINRDLILKTLLLFMLLILVRYNLKYMNSAFREFVVVPSKYNVNKFDLIEGKPLSSFDAQLEVIDRKRNLYSQIPFEKQFLKLTHEVISIRIKNRGKEIWYSTVAKDGKYGVNLSYHVFKKENLDVIIADGLRTRLPKNIQPGEEIETDMFVLLPNKKGEYIIRLSFVQEGVSWFYNHSKGFQDIEYIIK